MTKQELVNKLIGDYYEQLMRVDAEKEITLVKVEVLKKHTKEQLILVHRLICIMREILDDKDRISNRIIQAYTIEEAKSLQELFNDILDALLIYAYLAVDWMYFERGDNKKELIERTNTMIDKAGKLGRKYHDELTLKQ